MLEYLALALALATTFAAAWFLRRQGGSGQVEAALAHLAAQQQGVAAAAQAQQRDVAALLEATRAQQQASAALQASLEQQRVHVGQLGAAVAAASQGLAEVKQAGEAQRLASGETRNALAQGIAEAKQMLARVEAEAKARAEREQAAFASLARLEEVIAGTHSRGAAGENMLAEVIKALPAEFRAYDVRIGGKTVEFAIPLPDGRYLPVDSKWTSVEALAALATATPEEREGLVAGIQGDVERKVEEVAKYLDPEKTPMMAVLAVPDAVFHLCAEAHVTAHQRGVVIVPYGMAVPYVLSVLQVIRRFGARVDEAQLSHMVGAVLGALEEMDDELDSRFAKSLTQLDNSRRTLRGSIGKAKQAVGRVNVDPGAGEGRGNGHAAFAEAA